MDAPGTASPSFLSQLTSLLTVLIALSVSTERLVAIVQNFVPQLRNPNPGISQDGPRQAWLQLLAVAAGIATAFMAKDLLPISLLGIRPDKPLALVLLGLLASGGSGFWTSLLGYVTGLKDVQKNLAATTKMEAVTSVAAAHQALAAAKDSPQDAAVRSEELSSGASLPTSVRENLAKAVEATSNCL